MGELRKDHWARGVQQIATQEHLDMQWGVRPKGKGFRCYLCGHKFKLGDKWRFDIPKGRARCPNFFVCTDCDGDDVIDRFEAHVKNLYEAYWWANPDHENCHG